MPVAIDSTIAGYRSNSYVDVATCDDYWAGHYSSTKAASWAALTSDQKSSVLIAACRVLEGARCTIRVPISEYSLHWDHLTGKLLDVALSREPIRWMYYQYLQFPRNLDYYPDTGVLYVPPPVQNAQCEQAMYLLNYDESAVANRLTGVVTDSLLVGRGQVHIAQEYTPGGTSFAPAAVELMRPFFISGAKLRRG